MLVSLTRQELSQKMAWSNQQKKSLMRMRRISLKKCQSRSLDSIKIVGQFMSIAQTNKRREKLNLSKLRLKHLLRKVMMVACHRQK